MTTQDLFCELGLRPPANSGVVRSMNPDLYVVLCGVVERRGERAYLMPNEWGVEVNNKHELPLVQRVDLLDQVGWQTYPYLNIDSSISYVINNTPFPVHVVSQLYDLLWAWHQMPPGRKPFKEQKNWVSLENK